MSGNLSVTFWGVRGSIACPGRRYERYGGNTSCLEMRCGPHLLVFDGGTGLRALGEALKTQGPLDIDLFLTHSHLDHMVGVPFFLPLFDPASNTGRTGGSLNCWKATRQASRMPKATPIQSVRSRFMGRSLPASLGPCNPFPCSHFFDFPRN